MKRSESSHPEGAYEVREVASIPAQYEIRECERCFGGRVYESSVPTGRWIPCPACKGAGKKSVYVYAKKGRPS